GRLLAADVPGSVGDPHRRRHRAGPAQHPRRAGARSSRGGAPRQDRRVPGRAEERVTIELVVTDLDGTLWTAGEQLHHSTLDAWRTLEARGVTVMVATGRRVTSTREPLARLGLTPHAVVLNGALAVDLATDERFHRSCYTAVDAARVLAAFRAV